MGTSRQGLPGAALILMASTLVVSHAGAAEIGVGDALTMRALVVPSVQTEQYGVLKLTVTRSHEAPYAALSIDVSIPISSGSVHVSTVSLYGLRPGEATSFLLPLPSEAMSHVQDGGLPLELRLQGPSGPNLALTAKVDVKEAIVTDSTIQ